MLIINVALFQTKSDVRKVYTYSSKPDKSKFLWMFHILWLILPLQNLCIYVNILMYAILKVQKSFS